MRYSRLLTIALCLAIWPGLATAAGTYRPKACPTRLTAERALQELEEANARITSAGEHPNKEDLSYILPRLHRAAYAGNHEAQLRFGNYVVGYYLTDEMFWPRDPHIAVPALAMLRIAALAERESPNALIQALGRTPITFTDPEGAPALPRAWIRAALREAKRYTTCQNKHK